MQIILIKVESSDIKFLFDFEELYNRYHESYILNYDQVYNGEQKNMIISKDTIQMILQIIKLTKPNK